MVPAVRAMLFLVLGTTLLSAGSEGLRAAEIDPFVDPANSSAAAWYDPATGEFSVQVANVNSWLIARRRV